MADFPTFQDLFRIARDEALSHNTKLTQEAIDREGTDINAIMAAAAAVGDECIGQLARVQSGLFLDSAQKEQLTRYVYDRYTLLKKPASAAIGSVAFSTTAANPSAFSIPVNTRLKAIDGKTFLTTTEVSFPASSTGPVYAAVRSAEAGLNQQAAKNTIRTILDMPVGSPSDLAVTNPLATAGADDEESDDLLRERARRFFTTARRGTVAAIQSAAENVPGVRRATAFEVTDAYGRPAKGVTLVISDAFTEALVATNPTPAAYQDQSRVLADQVFLALYDWRAGGIFVDVRVALVQLLSVRLALTFKAGVDVDDVALRARAQIVGYVNALPPGATFSVAEAVNRLRRVPGLLVTGDEIASPSGNVVPQILEVLRTTMGLVVAISLQSDRALQSGSNPDSLL